jgi:hypothetical protein
MVTVEAVGHVFVSEKLAKAIPAAHAATTRGIAAAALLVERRAKLIATQKHIIDTGWLRSNIFPEMTGPLSAKVISSANYSLYIEFGHHTRGGKGWVEARPYMRPALDEEKDNITKCVGSEVIRSVEASILV